jgi:hypothetical protein
MRKSYCAGFSGAVLTAALLLAAASSATTLLRLTVEKMSVQAEMIVVGDVTEVKSQWNTAGTMIYTFVAVDVTQCIAGACGETVKIKQRGGSVGQWSMPIPGMPRFVVGQKVLLFLEKDPEGVPGYAYVLGMCQGMFLIAKDAKDGQSMAVQQGGAALADVGVDGVIRVLPGEKPLKVPLKNLLKKIKTALKNLSKGEVKP